MKKYKVNVNGTDYEIGIELLSDDQMSAAPAQAPAAQAPAAAPAQAANGAGEQVKCPMPGTILDVKVAVGDAVKKGQVLMILEAMKMETSILSTFAGTVKDVLVKEGDKVQPDDLLVVFESIDENEFKLHVNDLL